MPEQRIEVHIDENGAITAKTNGLKGIPCLEELEAILGNEELIDLKKTDEYFQQSYVKLTKRQDIRRGQ